MQKQEEKKQLNFEYHFDLYSNDLKLGTVNRHEPNRNRRAPNCTILVINLSGTTQTEP